MLDNLDMYHSSEDAGQSDIQGKEKTSIYVQSCTANFQLDAATLKQIFVNICSTIFAQYSHASALDVVMVRVGGTLAPARERNSLKLQKNVRTKNTRPQSQHCHHCFCRPRMEHWKIFVLLQKIFVVLLYILYLII